ncbi:mechanosensitive ion channel family protein [Virgibacillus natechei]|uniref:mechanosensitive ion channel family protein n=1 Tax=Virgibacillus sp. CBA3643 TaxID=2942278 RepID=UPI0035A3CFD4
MDTISNQFVSLWEYLTGPELWISLGSGLLRIVLIVILAVTVVKVTRKLVDKLFKNRGNGGPMRITVRRENTLKKLIKNVVAYVVYFIAIIMVLENVLQFDIGPLIASAGVVGLAIGFGAQNLVRDVISGFFIIFEDQFSVGDYVAIGGIEGYVEEIGLRTTKVLSWTGEMNVLPNGNVTQVTNYSVHNGLAIVDINIPYESNVADAESIINEVAPTLPGKYEFIVGTPEIIGVQNLEVSHFVIRVIADTWPGYQWAGERSIRKEMQDQLYKEGIQIPAPRVVMYNRSDGETLAEQSREREQ